MDLIEEEEEIGVADAVVNDVEAETGATMKIAAEVETGVITKIAEADIGEEGVAVEAIEATEEIAATVATVANDLRTKHPSTKRTMPRAGTSTQT